MTEIININQMKKRALFGDKRRSPDKIFEALTACGIKPLEEMRTTTGIQRNFDFQVIRERINDVVQAYDKIDEFRRAVRLTNLQVKRDAQRVVPKVTGGVLKSRGVSAYYAKLKEILYYQRAIAKQLGIPPYDDLI